MFSTTICLLVLFIDPAIPSWQVARLMVGYQESRSIATGAFRFWEGLIKLRRK